MHIPFVDLKAQYESIKTDIDTAIQGVIAETAFIGGKYVKAFEQKFAELYGVKHVVACANGTDSLYILMRMMGIGKDDEVITVANSWISSSETIGQTGATPVFVDIDPDYYSIDEKQLDAAITNKTKAIILVHLQGQMCNMDAVMRICNTHNIKVIEDCAQSHFSEYNSIRAGLTGIAGSFSFYPGKNLGAYGDAGCIITNDADLAAKCRMYANHGSLVKHKHEIEGINSRMDGLQAAILTAKLPYILEWTEKRIAAAKLYDKYLAGIPQIVTPKVRPNTKHTFHVYMTRAERRDALMAYLKDKGVETALHYPVALPNLKAYEYLGLKPGSFPVATKYQNEILSLPIYPELTEDKIAYIAAAITDFYKS